MRIKIEGVDELQKAFKDKVSLDDIKKVVRHNGAQLQNKTMQKANFKGHFEGKKFVKPTGTTKRSIALTIKDLGLTAEVEPTTEYSPYLEYGTRFMEAQPFVRPAYEEQKEKFKKDLEKLMK
jgi:HK97 gp10 family phage protein